MLQRIPGPYTTTFPNGEHRSSENRSTKPWSDERTAILKRLWSNGYTARQIARQLGGVTRNAVIGKVHRLGLQGRDTTIRTPAQKPRKRRGVWAKGDGRSANGCKPHIPKPRTTYSLFLSNLAPDAPPPKPPAEADIARVAFADLAPHHCRWPISDTWDGPVKGYCGCKSVPGLPYCTDHAARAFRQPESRQRSADEVAAAKRNTVAHFARQAGEPLRTFQLRYVNRVDILSLEVIP